MNGIEFESQEIALTFMVCWFFFFYKSARIIQWGKEQSFQRIVLGQLDIHIQKTDSHLTPYTKINPKWINDLNVRAGEEGHAGWQERGFYGPGLEGARYHFYSQFTGCEK